ncbi:B3/B4 domain-containing protein [Phreatobacter stygius]|uniref:B3/B4 domain-containing protein n=1 Tax=Phreatobacter stygius TaxID=1940610 RepID=UPI0026D2CAFA
MVSSFVPEITSAIFALRPDFRALSIVASGVQNGPTDQATGELMHRACSGLGWASWGEAHLEAWRDAYRAFGAKPQRTPCSAEALRKRVERDGAPPSINAVVDLYNAVSIRFALPVGGENIAAYAGLPRLVQAVGGEPFETFRDGVAHVEGVDAGEVVWLDDRGVTCRRWNWRQGPRTRIAADTVDMWFVLERLAPMPVPALFDAGDMLVDGLKRLAPEAVVTQVMIEPPALPEALAARLARG